jgi:hypothetical protein
MTLTGQNLNDRWKTGPVFTFCTTKSHMDLTGIEPGFHNERPTTDHLSHGMPVTYWWEREREQSKGCVYRPNVNTIIKTRRLICCESESTFQYVNSKANYCISCRVAQCSLTAEWIHTIWSYQWYLNQHRNVHVPGTRYRNPVRQKISCYLWTGNLVIVRTKLLKLSQFSPVQVIISYIRKPPTYHQIWCSSAGNYYDLFLLG